MRQYVLYSSFVHAALLSFVFFTMKSTVKQIPKNYYIDFIGQAPIETTQNQTDNIKTDNPQTSTDKDSNIKKENQEPAKKNTAVKQSQKKDFSEENYFEKNEDLRPSMANSESRILSEAAASNSQAQGSQGAASSAINTDSDFPYPWYITQIREILWDSWRAVMPINSSLKSMIKFKIDSRGRVSDIEIEKSSGNRIFDQAALSAVENATKFPPLPEGFFEDFLTVHVEFRNRGI